MGEHKNIENRHSERDLLARLSDEGLQPGGAPSWLKERLVKNIPHRKNTKQYFIPDRYKLKSKSPIKYTYLDGVNG